MSELPREHRPLYEALKQLLPTASIEWENGALKHRYAGVTRYLAPKPDGTVEVGGEVMTPREFVEGLG